MLLHSYPNLHSLIDTGTSFISREYWSGAAYTDLSMVKIVKKLIIIRQAGVCESVMYKAITVWNEFPIMNCETASKVRFQRLLKNYIIIN